MPNGIKLMYCMPPYLFQFKVDNKTQMAKSVIAKNSQLFKCSLSPIWISRFIIHDLHINCMIKCNLSSKELKKIKYKKIHKRD